MMRMRGRRSAVVLAVLTAWTIAISSVVPSSTALAAARSSARVVSVTTLSQQAALPSAGCSAPARPEVTEARVDISVNGAPRWYLLTTPAPDTPVVPAQAGSGPSSPGAPIPRPLVLDFHGLDEGAELHAATTQFGALGQRDGFVSVFPDGSGDPVQWDTTSHAPTNHDLVFVQTLLAQVEAAQCIDTSRVYASGFSDGSFMVSLLACTMSGTFAAIGAVSGLQFDRPCHTAKRVPVITFHGTADPILYFNGGIGTSTLDRLIGLSGSAASSTTTTPRPLELNGPGVPATVRAWAAEDGCRPGPTNTTVARGVLLRSYRCPADASVEFYIILGGGHSWPGSVVSESLNPLAGSTTMGISATDLMWSFFQRYRT